MASVSFSFNLDPVASGTTQATAAPAAASNTAVSAKYEAAQAGFQGQPGMAGISSPACDAGGCFIVHGEGPGVTTLSVGEEGGGGGDFIALPVLDGVGFLEAPAPSFVGVADYNITTLAIGEDQGSGVSSVAEIGSETAQSPQFAMEPVYGTTEIGSVAPLHTAQTDLAPIQTVPIVEPRAKPESAMAASAMPATDVASAQPQVSPVELGPIAEPRAKPETLTSFTFPLPDMKPGSFAASGVETASATSTGTQASNGNYVSVGDYDSYVASVGSGTPAASIELADTPVAVEAPISDAATPATPSSVAVTFNAPPPVTDVAAPSTSMAGAPVTPAPAVETAAPERVEMTFQPVGSAPVESVADAIAAPRMKPASFTTPGPASLAPIQTVPIDTVPIQTAPGLAPMPVSSEVSVVAPQAETGMTFTTVDGPVPMGKPEGVSVESPRLSDEDFKITTLAYGEEDAGGG